MRSKKGQLELEHWIIIFLGLAIVGLVVYGIYFYKPTNKIAVTKEECTNFMKGVSAKVSIEGVDCPQDSMFLNEAGQLVYFNFCEKANNSSTFYVLVPGLDTSKSMNFLFYYKNKTTFVTSVPQ